MPFPEIQNDDVEARLQDVADTEERMCGTLGLAVGNLFRRDPDLRPDLDSVFTLLGRSPWQMDDWLFFVAYEGTHQVLTGVQAHYVGMNLASLVQSMPEDREPRLFFEEVSEDTVYTAGACDLQSIVKSMPRDEDVAS